MIGSTAVRELRWSVRRIMRHSGRSTLIVAVLGLALATNAVMVGVLDQLFFADPPLIKEPQQLVRISQSIEMSGRRVTRERLSYPDYQRIAEQATELDGVAGSFTTSVSIGEGVTSRRAAAAFVSSTYFQTLGVYPRLGRTFAADEDVAPDGEHVVIIGYELWDDRFGGDPGAIGKALQIEGVPFRIIGILPQSFHGTDWEPVELWLPMSVGGSRLYGSAWDFNSTAFWIQALGRLKSGTQRSQLASHLSALVYGSTSGNVNGIRFVVDPLNRARGSDRPLEARVALWLGGVALVVLLIACTNIGNLHLVRGFERRSELAVRLALGGTRRDIVLSVLGEAMLLSVGGACLALLITVTIRHVLDLRLLGATVRPTVAPDIRLLVTMTTITVVVAIVTSLFPIRQTREHQLSGLLRSLAVTRNRAGNVLRFLLLAIQVTLMTVLLCGAGLFLLSFRAVTRIDTGFEPERVVVVNMDPQHGYATPALEQQYASVRQALSNDRNVERTAIGISAPFLSGVAIHIEIPGRDSFPSELGGAAYVNAVTPEFFGTLGLRIIQGRIFDITDAPASRVAVVSRHFAETAWPGGNAIGKCLQLSNRSTPCFSVVGVIADPKRDKLGEEPASQFFVPLSAAPSLSNSRLLFVRVRSTPQAATVRIVQAVQRTLPHEPYPVVRPLATMISQQQRPWAMGAVLFSVFSGLAMLIACLGLYNVVFHDVKAREHELAIRVVLGANGRDVARTIATRTGVATLVGLAVGLVVATFMGVLIEPILFRTAGVNPGLDIVIALMTLCIASVAGAGPLRRAARIQPAVILRDG